MFFLRLQHLWLIALVRLQASHFRHRPLRRVRDTWQPALCSKWESHRTNQHRTSSLMLPGYVSPYPLRLHVYANPESGGQISYTMASPFCRQRTHAVTDNRIPMRPKRSVDRAEFGEEISEDELLRIVRLEQRLSWPMGVSLRLRGTGELVDLSVLSCAAVEITYV